MSEFNRRELALECAFGSVSVERWIDGRYVASVDGYVAIGRTHMLLCMMGISKGDAIKNLFDQVALSAKTPKQITRGQTSGAFVYNADGSQVAYNAHKQRFTVFAQQ